MVSDPVSADSTLAGLHKHKTHLLVERARNHLCERYGYPTNWFPDRWHFAEHESGVSLVVCTKHGSAILAGLILVRPVPHPVTALKQVFSDHPSCSLGFILDDSGLSAYRYRSKTSDLVACDRLEPYDHANNTPLRSILTQSEPSTRPAQTSLRPLTKSVESIFFEAHSHIRDIDGLHADEALDELCKVLHVKLFDELQTPPGEPLRVQSGLYGNTAELATSIKELYLTANRRTKDLHYGLDSRFYKTSRGVFDDPIYLSAPALAKVVNEFEHYDLVRSNLDVKGRAFQKLFSPTARAGMGQYFTPHCIIQFMVSAVAPGPHHRVLDPFCGSGHFLTTALEYARHNHDRSNPELFARDYLHGIEKSERMVRIATTDMSLHGNTSANIRCTDALLPFSSYHDLEPDSFDLVLTNPPFGSVLGEDAIRSLGDFKITNGRKKVPLELLGIERSLEFLRPGGRLAIVLPESVFVNRSSRFVRDWLSRVAHVQAIVSLPIETFTPFGANIKTSILFCQKRGGKRTSRCPSVFLGVIENVGYDAAGRPREGNDSGDLLAQVAPFVAP